MYGIIAIVSGLLLVNCPGFGERYQLSSYGRFERQFGGVIAIVFGIFLLAHGV
jgi:hypothetical protein